ncbi:hypothetical protein E4K67_01375 [Desulfosporosinus fructosivorans]|uniref:DUF2878 domain-containing protein n=1 Tax=Desulfosporosinus fructosivorans TaxID=2018669 RepID=A0A4Z0RA15_9FIRM|nr:hypothetical protein [Desulfosporosinus fructosivorans]TGE39678.1 hypothetical protein E4K67_01375 [Desulfosporosinus fructosivorans]
MRLDLPYLYYYLIFTFGLLFLILAFIPKLEIKKLFWFGLLWGSGLDFLVEYIYHFVHLTKYQHMAPFNIGVLPLWTILAWTPAVMLFIYFLPQQRERYIYWIYVIMWSTFISFVAMILRQLDILVFINGGPWIWFIGSFIFLSLMTKHYRSLEASNRPSS